MSPSLQVGADDQHRSRDHDQAGSNEDDGPRSALLIAYSLSHTPGPSLRTLDKINASVFKRPDEQPYYSGASARSHTERRLGGVWWCYK